MKAINLIWIIPLCTLFGWFMAINFISPDINVSMDNNTRDIAEIIYNISNNLELENRINESRYIYYLENDVDNINKKLHEEINKPLRSFGQCDTMVNSEGRYWLCVREGEYIIEN